MKRSAPGAARIVSSWLVLLALLAATATLSRWHLGEGNLIASLCIATLKIAVVAWVFMGLRDAARSVRLAASIGLVLLLVLLVLSGLDLGGRAADPAPWQSPEQLAPRLAQPHGAGAR